MWSVPGERLVRAHRRLFTHPWGIKMAIWICLFVRVRWTILDALISSPKSQWLNTVKVYYSLMQVKWLVWQFSSQCWLGELAFFLITIPLILLVASMPKSKNWAIVYVFDDQAWKWYLLPLPTSLLIPTKYQGRLRDIVQGPGKGYGTGEHLLSLP